MTSLRKASKIGIDPSRSALMARVRQKHTSPELAVRRQLRKLGITYRLHRKDLPGSPDICISKFKCAIFVHGCFWHRHPGCKKASSPKTRHDFWTTKFLQNQARDFKNVHKLKELGWQALVIWECETKNEELLSSRLKLLLAQAGVNFA